MNTTSSRNCNGYTLALVLIIVALLAASLAGAMALTIHSRGMMVRSIDSIDTSMIADSCLTKMFIEVKAISDTKDGMNFVDMVELSKMISITNAPTNVIPNDMFGNPTAKILNYAVLPINKDGSVNTSDTFGTPADTGTNDIRFLGVVWVQSLKNTKIVTKVQQEFRFRYQPIFQWAIFYNKDMELFPGPDMTIGGPVHANGNIFFHNSGKLNFLGNVTYTAGMFTNNNPASTNLSGGFQYATGGTYAGYGATSTNLLINSSQKYAVTPQTPPGTSLSTNVANPNMSTNGAIELIQRPVFSLGGTNFDDPFALPSGTLPNDPSASPNTRMFYKAGLRVMSYDIGSTNRIVRFFKGDVTPATSNGNQEITPDGLVTYDTTTGNPISTNTAVSGVNYKNLFDKLTNAFVPSNFVDYRWNSNANGNVAYDATSRVTTVTAAVATNTYLSYGNQPVTVTNTIGNYTNPGNVATVELDVNGLLKNGGSDNNASLLDGIIDTSKYDNVIYVSNIDGNSSTAKRGVTLKNGSVIPAAGLTIVSDNPVYIAGNYNTGNGTPWSNTSMNMNVTSNLMNSTVSNSASDYYTRKGASVMADAVSLVSSIYLTNTMYQPNITNRLPVSTTYNVAVLSGDVESTTNYTSGGAHNFPRFLEWWGTANYQSKFSSLTNCKTTINGSFVCLFASEQNNTPFYCNPINNSDGQPDWGNMNVSTRYAELSSSYQNSRIFNPYYGAPARAWSYDTQYNSPANLPPGTPMVKTLIMGQYSKVY